MSTALPPKLMTLEEFTALPDDGMDRELILGEMRERPMTKRNRFHAKAEATIAYLIKNWLLGLEKPRGEVYSGEVGCILSRDPDTNVGIDVAYFSAETVARQTDFTTLIEGAPVLAVEILSPSDKHEEITEKIDVYLTSGVDLIWIVDTHFKTVVVHRREAAPELFNAEQHLTSEPFLPGFKVGGRELFE